MSSSANAGDGMDDPPVFAASSSKVVVDTTAEDTRNSVSIHQWEHCIRLSKEFMSTAKEYDELRLVEALPEIDLIVGRLEDMALKHDCSEPHKCQQLMDETVATVTQLRKYKTVLLLDKSFLDNNT